MSNYFTANTTIEIICFGFAVICLINDSSLVWKSMILYLFLTCVTEILGIIIPGPSNLISNHWVYNIFLICEAGFTHLMFAYLLSKYINSKPIVIIGLAILCIVYTGELIDHGFLVYNHYTYTVMSVLFVVYSLYYYYLLLKDDNYVRLKYSPEFWWVAGTLFFYFTNTACNLFYDNLRSVILWDGHHLTYYIFRVLNILLYGCWSYSFICKKWLITTSKV
jgi:hypothetical protein